MYGKISAGTSVAGGALLPATGVNALGLCLMAVTLVMAGIAVLSVMPKLHLRRNR